MKQLRIFRRGDGDSEAYKNADAPHFSRRRIYSVKYFEGGKDI